MAPTHDDELLLDLTPSEVRHHPLVRRACGVAELTLPPVPPLPEPVLEVALRGWEERVRSEYLGVLIFRHLHDLLIDLSAPMDLQHLALTLMAHESHHAWLCLQVAQHLGSSGELVFDRGELALPRTREPLPTQLADHVTRVLCCGEVVAFELLRHTLKVLPPSPYRDVLRRVLKDEVLHARAGFEILRSMKQGGWCRWVGDDHVRAVVSAYGVALGVRDVIDDEEAALFREPEAAAALSALGLPPSEPFKACYHAAIPSSYAPLFTAVGIPLGGAPAA